MPWYLHLFFLDCRVDVHVGRVQRREFVTFHGVEERDIRVVINKVREMCCCFRSYVIVGSRLVRE